MVSQYASQELYQDVPMIVESDGIQISITSPDEATTTSLEYKRPRRALGGPAHAQERTHSFPDPYEQIPQDHVSVEFNSDEPGNGFLPSSRPPSPIEDADIESVSSLRDPNSSLKRKRTQSTSADEVDNTDLKNSSPVIGSSSPGRQRKRRRDLRVTISKKMSKIGLDKKKPYISNKDLSALISGGSILETIPNAPRMLIEFIKKNKKLFAITILVITDGAERLEAMNAFLHSGFSDKSLPVRDMTEEGICAMYSQSSDPSDEESEPGSEEHGERMSLPRQCNHKRALDIFHESPWDHHKIQRLYETQWSFFVPVFRKAKFQYEFAESILLPFKDVESGRRWAEGHFSAVYRAMMLTSHQDTIATNYDVIRVAIKELTHHVGKEYNIQQDWDRESKALSILNELDHKHIVKGIGAFKQGDKYYLVMEWADGGSLQDFWENGSEPHLEPTASRTMQLLTQLNGLAHGMKEMHYFKATQEEENSGLKPKDNPENDPNDSSWRHGDLKPTNILVFDDSSEWLGTLKLGDLGRAKHHPKRTVQRSNGTRERFSTPQYDPPQVWTALDEPRSRQWDVWSFGCILLESVVWLLCGLTELKELGKLADGSQSLSPYWTCEVSKIDQRSAKVRPEVSVWIQHMLKTHPQCKEPSAIRDLLVLVRDKLLVVDVSSGGSIPMGKSRADSRALCKALGEVISKSKEDSSYLFKRYQPTVISQPSIQRIVPKMDDNALLRPNQNLTPANLTTRRTSWPLAARPLGESRNDSYLHDFDDTWQFEEDNDFANMVTNLLDVHTQRPLPKVESALCEKCKRLDLGAPDLIIKDSVDELRHSASDGCNFCAIRLAVAQWYRTNGATEFRKFSSGLRISSTVRGPPQIFLRRAHGGSVRLDKGADHIQIGFPRIPKAGSTPYFHLLRAWLEDCDANHPRCHSSYTSTALPTRLIYVGSSDSPNLRLVESASMTSNEKTSLRFIAVSHPWGHASSHRHVCTTTSNINDYKEKIRELLPSTLADAVTTTRALGVRYLWIDSLCVIQGDDGDFSEEAERMETVFSSAYCVLAATSAEGSSSGFLNRDSPHEVGRQPTQDAISIPCRPHNGGPETTVYVSTPIDDFQNDVSNGQLNQRGWVFQERALARRTIHFARNQTYWECGEGIRCETLTKMWNSYEAFLGDSNFPRYGLQLERAGDITFYEYLFEQYSKLSFSRPEDRPFAIRGLEQRLRSALKAKGRSERGAFGIIDEYWGRGLLWQRASGVPRMTRITSGVRGGKPVPSWSWMGYEGGIKFMQHSPHSIMWLASEIVLPWSRPKDPMPATTSYRGDSGLRGQARNFQIPPGEDNSDIFEILYEDKDRLKDREQKCLIVGRMKIGNRSAPARDMRNYVLIIVRNEAYGDDGVYQRVGAGYLHGSLIDFEGAPLSVRIE